MTEQKKRSSENTENRNAYRVWKKRRDIQLTALQVEVDLENREIFFKDDLKQKLNLEFNTTNVDRLITHYVDPQDSARVQNELQEAQRGQEQPIRFQFIHPITEERLTLEYRYEIVYVRYASTRLNGLLVNVRE
jgi:hypothetical protein